MFPVVWHEDTSREDPRNRVHLCSLGSFCIVEISRYESSQNRCTAIHVSMAQNMMFNTIPNESGQTAVFQTTLEDLVLYLMRTVESH